MRKSPCGMLPSRPYRRHPLGSVADGWSEAIPIISFLNGAGGFASLYPPYAFMSQVARMIGAICGNAYDCHHLTGNPRSFRHFSLAAGSSGSYLITTSTP